MKIVLLLIACFCVLQDYAQSLPMKEGRVFYEIVDSSRMDKNALFNNAKVWFANTFNDSKSVLEVSDNANGQLIGKGNVPTPIKVMGMLAGNRTFFTIRVDVKDLKYRLQVYNISIGGNAGGSMPIEPYLTKNGKNYKNMIAASDAGIQNLMSEFKKSVSKSSDTDF